jgi:hypothetical protein
LFFLGKKMEGFHGFSCLANTTITKNRSRLFYCGHFPTHHGPLCTDLAPPRGQRLAYCASNPKQESVATNT